MDTSLQALVERVRDAAGHSRALTLRGGGSKAFYGEPVEAGEVLDTRGHAGIVAYEPSELVVTVRAGTPLAELEAALAREGQCLPFEPPHFAGGATVGGMVACGLSGPARASVGAVRDYVLGVQLVNGRGEHLVFGGQVMKNVAGYDVSRLMVGAMGTLGLIAEVSLKVLPFAPAEATLRFALPQQEALDRLNAWGGQPLPLNASLWTDAGGAGMLLVRLRGAVAAVDAACRALGGERVADPESAQLWSGLREQGHPWFAAAGDAHLWRLSVPQTAPVLDMGAPQCIEWHGAQRWVHAPEGAGGRLRALAAAAGGHATLFRAAGTSAERRMHPLAPPIAHIHQELKRQFDPANVFNRGRMAPEI